MPRQFKVAVIGRTGNGNYGHGLDQVWKEVDNVRIVAVADDNPAGLQAAVRRLDAASGYADYREMLQKERPNIVSVATRNLQTHRDMVVACAEAGAHMFLEKPICRSLEEADAMIAACEKHHVKVAIAHQTRYSPRVARIKEMIEAGQLGDLLEMRGRGKEDQRGGGEDLMVLGTHLMDLMRFFAGDCRSCFGQVGMMGNERVTPATTADVHVGGDGIDRIAGTYITATYGFDKLATGYFATHRANRRPGDRDRFHLQLCFSRGIVQLTTGSLPAAYYLPDPSWYPGRSRAAWQEITSAGLGKPETLKDGGLGQGNVWIARDLMEAIERDRQPKGSIYDGRAALEMILAVYESHRLKAPVELPLRNRRHPLTML